MPESQSDRIGVHATIAVLFADGRWQPRSVDAVVSRDTLREHAFLEEAISARLGRELGEPVIAHVVTYCTCPADEMADRIASLERRDRRSESVRDRQARLEQLFGSILGEQPNLD